MHPVSSGRRTMSEITKALVKFQRNCPTIIKDKTADVVSKRTGGKYSYNYADLAGIMSAIRPVLCESGLFISQSFETNGTTYLITTVMHESGETLQSKIELPINGLSPQDAGSAITYYRRYSIIGLLGLAAEDDDGEAAQKAGAVHGKKNDMHSKQNDLTQQLKDSIAAENGKKNYDTLALPQHANDPKFHTLTGEDGKIIDLFKKTPEGLAWKRTACKEAVTPLFQDLDAAVDLSALEAVLSSVENMIRLDICRIAVPLWASEFERRYALRKQELTVPDNDLSRYLRA